MSYSADIGELVSEGAKLYATKEFDGASEKYGEACEVYNKQHDEDDADLLLLYGKSLFQSAVLNSEVFGGAGGGNQENDDGAEGADEKDTEEHADAGNFQFCDDAPLAEEEDEDAGPQAAEEEDEEDVDSSGGGEEEQKNEAGEEEQSDFEMAWEILDLTRSLFESRLDGVADQGKELSVPYLAKDNEETTNEFIILTKKLSETYDLLGEVSLEAENFPQSAIDLQNCLDLRLKLYNPENSSLISESHYKLSLALEFCVEDPELRSKAAEQMKLAIESVKRRNEKESNSEKKKDNDDLIQDLQVRYQELERDPAEELKNEQMNIIKGILGEPSGEQTSAPVSNVINDISSVVKKKADKPAVNDLTSMVKKRKSGSKDDTTSKKSKK